ncbi:MAG: hypothetical protein QOJ03_2549, partial [Frankiaceae bacterium]|nr:hypothetical protein [Frankiaceae bacterium]
PTGKVFRVGTTVTEKVHALDQHGQPIIGLFVTFFGSGPGQQNCNVSCGSSTTDDQGTASYTYAGNTQGNTQVTGVVTTDNNSNNELGRVTDRVGFDGVPSIHAPRSRHLAGRVHVFGHTRPGAIVRLFAKAKGHAHYHFVLRHRANGSGNYSFRPRISKTTRFYVRVDRIVNSGVRKVRVT